MAPVPDEPESFFLAPLDKCLGGTHSLISWKSAYDAFADVKLARSSPNLRWFILDDLSIAQLSREFEPIQPPSSQSRTEFETRTAAVNIGPSADGKYDTKQIKEDALWLSQEGKIDEVTALRIVVLEWQARPAARILCGYTEEENVSLQRVVKSSDLSMSVFSHGNAHDSAQSGKGAFLSEESRHARLLQILLSEREHVLAISFLLAATRLEDPLEPLDRSFGIATGSFPNQIWWLESAAKKCEHVRTSKKDKLSDPVSEAVEAIEKRLRNLETSSGWNTTPEMYVVLETAFQNGQVIEMTRILEILFVRISLTGRLMPSQSVQSWFSFVDQHDFFELVQIPFAAAHLNRFRALICLVSLHILRLPYVIDSLRPSSQRKQPEVTVLDQNWREHISESLLHEEAPPSAGASLARFAWSVILHAVDAISRANMTPSEDNRALSPQQTREDGLQKEAKDSNSLALRFARNAVDDSHAFQVLTEVALMLPNLFDLPWEWRPQLHARVALYEVLREGLLLTQYSDVLVQACLVTIQYDATSTFVRSNDTAHANISARLIEIFECDNILHDGILKQAGTRYPYEMSPFLRLCTALTPVEESGPDKIQPMVPLPQRIGTLTQTMPVDFDGFELPDDYDSNIIRLTQDLPLFSSTDIKSSAISSAGQKTNRLIAEAVIPKGTLGRVISETKPSLVMWSYQYSTLKYIALLLSTSSSGNVLLDKDTQGDSINLIATMCSRVPTLALTILEESSDGLERNQDIITIITDIFETELSTFKGQRDQGQIDLLSSCLRFFTSIMPHTPNRIWPILARSSLLGMDGRGSRMTTLVLAASVETSRQEFAHECVSLLDALITDVLSHALRRNSQVISPANRFHHAPDTSTGLSPKIMDQILLALTQQSIVLLQSSILEFQVFRLEVITKILGVLNRIVDSVYGFDGAARPQEKLTAVLATAADFVMETFLTTSGNTLPISLLSMGSYLQSSFGISIRSSLLHTHHALIRANLTLITTILHISRRLHSPSFHLEQQLFDTLPFLVRLYASEEAHRSSILVVLSALLRNAASRKGEPTSLLRHVAPDTAMDFVNMLEDSSRALDETNLDITVWEFLATAMDSKQKSLATIVVLGDTPKNSLMKKATSTNGPTKQSLLTTALDSLSKDLTSTKPHVPYMLGFVSAAQSYWPGVTSIIQKHPKFLNSAADFLDNFGENISTKEFEQSHMIFVASKLFGILSIYLHNTRQLNDTGFVKILGPKLTYFRDHAVEIPRSNASLHVNLGKNLKKKFPGCDLMSFRRAIGRRQFGSNYFYDTVFAAIVVDSDSDAAWKQGFSQELSRANVNISLVRAQLKLAESWKSLVLELSMDISTEKGVQGIMTKTVLECLRATADPRATESFLRNGLRESRAELAFALSQRLVRVNLNTREMRNILAATWNSIAISDPDFDTVLVKPDASYYRLQLKLLLLALQPHGLADAPSDGQENTGRLIGNPATPQGGFNHDAQADVLSVLRRIIEQVVGKGFRSLAVELHNNAADVMVSDVALLISILQGVLHVRNVHFIYSELTLRLCETNVHRYALALFSWSQTLLGPGNDPVIGELSISFLRELSSIPQMGDFLATESILNQLSTAPILGYLRQRPSGFGSLDQPFRLHTIWARGIVPLTLNLLVAVGGSFAAEATAFLNTFPHQLERITTAFGTKATGTGNITLDDAIEVHTLALIVGALQGYRGSATANGEHIPDLKGDWVPLREDLDGWFNGRGITSKGRIMPRSDMETSLVRAEPEGRVQNAANRLEEMVLEELQGALMCLGGTGGPGGG